MKRPCILFVGMPDSVHAARWIRQLDGLGWDLHFFPVNVSRPHELLPPSVVLHDQWHCGWQRVLKVEFNWPVHIRGMWRLRQLIAGHKAESCWSPLEPDVFPVTWSQARCLAGVIRRIQPDIVHSLMITSSGYLVLMARRLLDSMPPKWIVQNWGNDIYLFGKLRGHGERIREILRTCDYYDCECDRDVALAREYGFGGEVLPVRPNCGGYDLTDECFRRQRPVPSARRTILVKGYQGWQGRALVALRALERVSDLLRSYRVKVYSARTSDVVIAGRMFAARTGLPVEFVDRCTHREMLDLHGESRISLGLNISDGICISVLEAILMGAFPVQSDTGGAGEWFRDGESGMQVPPEDPDVVADALLRVLRDDALVDRAATINWKIAEERLDERKVRPVVVDMYRRILAG